MPLWAWSLESRRSSCSLLPAAAVTNPGRRELPRGRDRRCTFPQPRTHMFRALDTPDPTITLAVIGPMPRGMFDPNPAVTATFEDGTIQELFTYFPDEISFVEDELVGLTERQAYDLFRKKDLAYLQS